MQARDQTLQLTRNAETTDRPYSPITSFWSQFKIQFVLFPLFLSGGPTRRTSECLDEGKRAQSP